jgi:hypothetical protein
MALEVANKGKGPAVSTHDDVQETANRLLIIGKIVRAGIADQGIDISQAAKNWEMSRSTLTRMIAGEKVSAKFYGVAAVELGLPPGLFRLIREGDTETIEELKLDPYVRRIIRNGITTDPTRATGT